MAKDNLNKSKENWAYDHHSIKESLDKSPNIEPYSRPLVSKGHFEFTNAT